MLFPKLTCDRLSRVVQHLSSSQLRRKMMEWKPVEIVLGMTYEDGMTGFKGIALATMVHLFDPPHVLLQPRTTDGKMTLSEWIDTRRIRPVSAS